MWSWTDVGRSLVSEPETDLIEAIRNGLPPGVEFDEREETLLSLAARQAHDVERAEADLEERGLLVSGSQGQQVVNPTVSEARQGRVVLGRLLGQLDLPESTTQEQAAGAVSATFSGGAVIDSRSRVGRGIGDNYSPNPKSLPPINSLSTTAGSARGGSVGGRPLPQARVTGTPRSRSTRRSTRRAVRSARSASRRRRSSLSDLSEGAPRWGLSALRPAGAATFDGAGG